MKDKINIVMTTDENYIIQTIVTLYSILSYSHSDVLFDLYILCSPTLDKVSRNMLKRVENTDSRATIKFVEVNDYRLDTAKTTAHIPIASYYRLYISSLIQEDRCLFVDGDMIIRDDITNVYNTNLEGNYIAGVKDLGVNCNLPQFKDYAAYLGIPNMDSYVNAGFMLFNIRKIREQNLHLKMINAIGEGYKYMDQDILNKYCYGNIKVLPLKYNFFMEYYGSMSNRKLDGYSEDEIEGIEQKMAVMHYTGFFKPWLCTRLKLNDIWWETAKNILEDEIYDKMLKKARDFEINSDWKHIISLVNGENNIAVFGFSEIGKKVVNQLDKTNMNNEIVIADNDTGKQGLYYNGILCMSVIDVLNKYDNPIWIICSQNYYIPIRKQLCEIGIPSQRIIRYINKDENYYARLDERYYEYEIKMLE